MWIFRQKRGRGHKDLPFVWVSGNRRPISAPYWHISKQACGCSDCTAQSQAPHAGSIHQLQSCWLTRRIPAILQKNENKWILIGPVIETIQTRTKQQVRASVKALLIPQMRSAGQLAVVPNANSFLKDIRVLWRTECLSSLQNKQLFPFPLPLQQRLLYSLNWNKPGAINYPSDKSQCAILWNFANSRITFMWHTHVYILHFWAYPLGCYCGECWKFNIMGPKINDYTLSV